MALTDRAPLRANIELPTTHKTIINWSFQHNNIKKDSTSFFGHIHPYYEMYVYLSGNISFAVNNTIYSLRPGDIIFTAPSYYHHCIYHEDCRHEHFCLYFPNPEPILESTFKLLAQKVYLHYPEEIRERIIESLMSIYDYSENQDMKNQFALVSEVYRLMSLLCTDLLAEDSTDHPENLQNILHYIGEHYMDISTIGDLTANFYMSQSTMERLFKKYLNITPYQYLENTRMAGAVRSLLAGKSVSQSALENGYPNCSHFITIFKKYFFVTPGQYQKENRNPGESKER